VRWDHRNDARQRCSFPKGIQSRAKLYSAGRSGVNARQAGILGLRLRLRARAGDYVAVMDESRIGKSALLNLIAGSDRADKEGGQQKESRMACFR
jgi:hypothetical protein